MACPSDFMLCRDYTACTVRIYALSVAHAVLVHPLNNHFTMDQTDPDEPAAHVEPSGSRRTSTPSSRTESPSKRYVQTQGHEQGSHLSCEPRITRTIPP
ncbi:hypothetical protein D9619_013525 [Psilocybe cf. subviscida]|uniref:Uncharacterized protein n=1 Tax=Psilocybe cf. subviscida TaxID=2480587 RepID=A0A8H5BH36_9AGAR|nr:hypothetical protein D9619_013525 [Psilocybe cf. subviscida]